MAFNTRSKLNHNLFSLKIFIMRLVCRYINLFLIILLLIFNYNYISHEEFGELIIYLVTKTQTKLGSKINGNQQIRFMKRFANGTKLSPAQILHMAQGTELFLTCIFPAPFRNSNELIPRIWNYIQHKGVGESIYKQSMLKGFFPRQNFSKGQIISYQGQKNHKIKIEDINEICDVKFVGELDTTTIFVNTSNQIQHALLLNESPKALNEKKKMKIIVESPNKKQSLYDLEISVMTNQNQLYSYKADIKAGNNMYDPFSRILGHIWLKTNNKPYIITNDAVSVEEIQKYRLHVLTNYLNFNEKYLNNEQLEVFKGFLKTFKSILELSISDIYKHEIIQEELLKIMAYNLPNLNASFYVISQIEAYEFNAVFIARIIPHITPEIFSNHVNYQKFMRIAIKIYEDVFKNGLIDKIEKSKSTFWEGTGFENIADDVFK